MFKSESGATILRSNSNFAFYIRILICIFCGLAGIMCLAYPLLAPAPDYREEQLADADENSGLEFDAVGSLFFSLLLIGFFVLIVITVLTIGWIGGKIEKLLKYELFNLHPSLGISVVLCSTLIVSFFLHVPAFDEVVRIAVSCVSFVFLLGLILNLRGYILWIPLSIAIYVFNPFTQIMMSDLIIIIIKVILIFIYLIIGIGLGFKSVPNNKNSSLKAKN